MMKTFGYRDRLRKGANKGLFCADPDAEKTVQDLLPKLKLNIFPKKCHIHKEKHREQYKRARFRKRIPISSFSYSTAILRSKVSAKSLLYFLVKASCPHQRIRHYLNDRVKQNIGENP